MFPCRCIWTKYFSFSLFCQRNGHKVALRRRAAEKQVYNRPTVAEQVWKKERMRRNTRSGLQGEFETCTRGWPRSRWRSHDLARKMFGRHVPRWPSNAFCQCQIQKFRKFRHFDQKNRFSFFFTFLLFLFIFHFFPPFLYTNKRKNKTKQQSIVPKACTSPPPKRGRGF